MGALDLGFKEKDLRDPTQTSLHQIIKSTYKKVLFEKEQKGQTIPFHVQREFEKYLTCGVLAHGFVRLKCSFCKNEKLVAFSCKGRTLCLSCTGRNMADSAKHLVEEVIPPVPIRQWVLSLPFKHRYFLAYDNNLNTHFHILFTDRVFNENDHFFSFSPEQFINRLMALIPPPRMNLIRYHGVFGANHKRRKAVTKKAKELTQKKKGRKEKPKSQKYRTPWAELLKHVFLKDALTCSRCGETLEYVATIKDSSVAIKILNHLDYPVELQKFAKPRAPPIDEISGSHFPDFFSQENSW